MGAHAKVVAGIIRLRREFLIAGFLDDLASDTAVTVLMIVNTAVSVDHECVIEDAAHVAPGARRAGEVTVGRADSIAIAATRLPRVRIGDESEVAAGSLVLHDVPDGMIAFGRPARVRRPRTARAGAGP